MARYLLRLGELMLKKGSRPLFEKRLRDNIKNRLKSIVSPIEVRDGRFYFEAAEKDEKRIRSTLNTTFGLAGWHLCLKTAKTIRHIEQAVLQEAQQLQSGSASFKVEARRADKSFGLTSYQIASQTGSAVLKAFPHLKVDVKDPDFTLYVEVREQAYIYSEHRNEAASAAGGLPAGSAGRAVLLLSGGIDSPAAGWLAAKRGLALTCVHFHTPPYTGEEALAKTRALAQLLAPWSGGKLLFYAINFTPVQLAVNALNKPEYVTLLSRACMMQIAGLIARQRKAGALITGEALSQVASQTLESLSFTNSMADMLVLRPCIGMDKSEIVSLSKKLGTYRLSTQAGADCCSLFAPDKPKIHPRLQETQALFAKGGFEQLIEEAANQAEAEIIQETIEF